MPRYFKIWADPQSTGIFEESGDELVGELDFDELEIPDALWKKLSDWQLRYEMYVQEHPDIPTITTGEAKKLDDEGIDLCRAFQRALGGDAKITYYSDILGRRISYE